MAIGFRAAGAWTWGFGNNMSVPIPAAQVTGDLMLMFYQTKPYSDSPTIDQGWSSLGPYTSGTTAAGTDSGSMQVRIFYKIALSDTETDPTVNNTTNNLSGAAIAVFSKASTENWETPVARGGFDNTGTGISITVESDPGIIAGDYVAYGVGFNTDAATPESARDITTTGITYGTDTIATTGTAEDTGGGDGGGFFYYVAVSSGTSSAAPVITATAATATLESAGIMARLRVTPVAQMSAPGTITVSQGAVTASGVQNPTVNLTSQSVTITQGAVTAGFSPTDITGLVMWVKSDAGLYQDAARTTPATADGDVVGGWEDQSGAGNHMSQATTGNKPTLQNGTGDTHNGRGVVRFDGTDDWIRALFTINQPFSVFMVIKQNAWSSNAVILSPGTDGNARILQALEGTREGLGLFYGSTTNQNADLTTKQWGIVEAVVNGASSTLAINGQTARTGNPGATDPGDGVTIGARPTGGAPSSIEVLEICVYTGSVTGTDADDLRDYLNTRHNLYAATRTTYYVDDTGGSDSADGLTTGTAWQTVAKVNGAVLQPGDSVLFKKGETWAETLTPPSHGMTGMPITFGAYGSGALPVFDGANTRNFVLDGRLRKDIVWEDLRAIDAVLSNMQLDFGTHTVNRVEAHSSADQNFQNEGSTLIVTYNDCVCTDAVDDGFSLHSGTVTLNGCEISGCAQGMQDAAANAMTVVINDCYFHGNTEFNIETSALIDLTVNRTRFDFAATSGKGVQCIGELNYCVFDNSGASGVGTGAGFIRGSTAGTLDINNCTFYGGTGGYGDFIIGNGLTVNMKNCIVSNVWRFAFIDTTGVINADYGQHYTIGTKSLTTNTNELTTDPLLTAPMTGDFTLQSGSPCIDSGTNLSITPDFYGVTVPQNGTTDRGASEYVSTGAGTANPTSQSITVSQGTLTAAGEASTAPTTQSVTANQGALTAGGEGATTVTVQSTAITQGAVTAAGEGAGAATTQSVSVTQGALTGTGEASTALTVQSIAITQGAVTASAGANGDASITVQSVTVQQGALSASGEASTAPAGQSLTVTQGALTAGAEGVVALTTQTIGADQGVLTGAGTASVTPDTQTVTITQGAVSASASGQGEVTLASQSLGVQQGALTADGVQNPTVALSTQTVTVQQGAAVGGGDASAALGGQSVTPAQGVLVVAGAAVWAVTVQSVSVTQGSTLTASGTGGVTLSTQTVTVQQGVVVGAGNADQPGTVRGRASRWGRVKGGAIGYGSTGGGDARFGTVEGEAALVEV